MMLWTYAQLKQKIELELDLEDEIFVRPDELIGYVNKAISFCESAILKIDEDYFLSLMHIPLVAGVQEYAYPYDIYAYKIRGIEYSQGATIYPVNRFKRMGKLDAVELANYYPASNWYSYTTINKSQSGEAKIVLVPVSKETSQVSYPQSVNQTAAPMKLYYIRHANRVPLLGQIVPVYEQFGTLQVSVSDDSVALIKSYVTGDKLTVSVYGGTLPSGLSSSVQYYAIVNNDGTVSFATSLANANLGTKVAITSQGSGVMSVGIQASQNTIDNTVIDLPECQEFLAQAVRCEVYTKENDARLPGALGDRKVLYDDFVAALTEKEQDDNTQIQMDMSSYLEMN
jgi:hypothetical protein